MIPYGRQNISQKDVDEVVKVLKSDYLTQGPNVERFEFEVSSLTGSGYSVAVNSATSALHIACCALKLGPGDTLWTTPITFVASANCALYCGANVDFVDIDPNSFNICPDKLRKKLKKADLENRLPKILIPVHMSGQPCAMKEISFLAKSYGIKIIEDASHAIGSKYMNQPTGSCLYSDITVFSFHPVKIITTGEGGIATTNNEKLAKEMRMHRSHGITRDDSLMSQKSHGPWYYEQINIGWNYRMTDIQAALGISQLEKLHAFISKRHKFAKRYDKLLLDLPLTSPKQSKNSYSSYHLYIIQLHNCELHRECFEKLREAGIGVNLHYIPVHLQPFYKNRGFKYGDFPAAEDYYSRAISLPIYSSITNKQQDKVISELKKILQ